MRTRIYALLFLFFVVFSFPPNFVSAQRAACPPADSLVPCGGATCPCTLCDFFVMIQRIITFLLTKIVPAIAVLMIIIAGAMMVSAYAGQSGPEVISRAKRLLGALAIGLLIVYLAWIIVNLFLSSIGVASWTGLGNWWTIECQTPSGPVPPSEEGTYCGDGIWQPVNDDFQIEYCDGNDFPLGKSCLGYGFASLQEVSCYDCQVDTSGCQEAPPPAPDTFCGDGKVQTPNSEGVNEACDGADLNGFTCLDFGGFTKPEGLKCFNSCQFDTSGCSSAPSTYCGDGIVQHPNASGVDEQCEGLVVTDKTCADLGFHGGGILSCNNITCQYDSSQCAKAICGDNVVQNPNDDGVAEICDGTALTGKSCRDYGFDSGVLGCKSGCLEYDTAPCYNTVPGCTDKTAINYNPSANKDDGSCLYCGNNILDASHGEVCDGTAVGNKTCADFGMSPGVLTCLAGSNCKQFDTSGCGTTLPPNTGDRLFNCQYSGAPMNKFAEFNPSTGLVYLLGVWSINKVDSKDGTDWHTTCQSGWTGTASNQGWKDLNVFASTHPDGGYIAYAGYDGSYVFFSVKGGKLVINQDLCSACPGNDNGTCNTTVCTSLGTTCRNVPITVFGAPGNMCVTVNQCDLCGSVIGHICDSTECTAIGPNCVYNSGSGSCTLY
jgi:hypothetical protein